MNTADVVKMRLANQLLTGSSYTKPEEIVSWLVAMQAQEYMQSKWAIALRLPSATDQMIDRVFQDGKILRTHLMRPTWHFVTPADIHWLLKLTAPRVHQANAFMYRKLELEKKLFKRSVNVLIKALEGGKYLTRDELNNYLKQKKIFAEGHRLSYIMMYAELEGIICSGPRKGKKFTYALLEERVPQVKALTRQEALAAFTQRYFTSRGPATAKDFSYWSGLTMQEVKKGIHTLPKDFISEKINDQEYIFKPSALSDQKKLATFLMADYDEYGMSYKDRSVIFVPESARDGNPVFNHMLVIDGKLAGTWKPYADKKKITVETAPFIKLNKTQTQAVKNAVKKYITFFS